MIYLLMAFLGLLTNSSGSDEVYLISGERLKSCSVEFIKEEVEISQGSQNPITLKPQEICEIRFSKSSAPSKGRFPEGLLFIDSSFLGGRLTGGDGESMEFTNHAVGAFRTPIDLVAKLVLSNPSLPADFERFEAKGEDDVLYKVSKDLKGSNFICGALDEFTPEGVVFDSSLGLTPFLRKDIEAIVFAQTDPPEPLDGPRVFLVFKDGGGFLSGGLRKIQSDCVVLTTIFKDEILVKKQHIDSLIFKGPKVRFLSDLKPSEVKQTPFIGGPEFFLYPWKKNRSVTGQMLAAKGLRFAHGIGAHSRTELTYALNKQYAHFSAWAGISDEVVALPAQGSVLLKIHGDGKSLYKSPVLRGGETPVLIPNLDLTNIETLKFTFDFADNFDSGDRAFLGNPVLILK